jgi:hypothetical protein
MDSASRPPPKRRGVWACAGVPVQVRWYAVLDPLLIDGEGWLPPCHRSSRISCGRVRSAPKRAPPGPR